MPDPEPLVLETPQGRRLDGFLDLPEGSGPRPAVVICHGFKGFMEWGFFPRLGELLAQRGFVAVRFNLSGAGQRPGEDRVSDPEAFRRATFTRDREDLAAVLAAVGRELAPDRVDRERLGLFGHSRGGGSAVLAAAGEPRIRALVTWAAVATFDRWSDEEKRTWRERGEHPVVNARTGQELALGLEVLEDAESGAVDVTAAAGRVEAPWLIVHGEADESVSFEDARTLLEASGGSEPGRRELLAVPGAGHTFGAVHPFAGPTPALIQAMNATQTWFRRHLG
ncbi:MAG: alpha/beta hydrolase [Thermoanaerobaculia bacterium]